MTDGELWSWVRSVMAQGACIQQDYASGLAHKTYEAYSARLDTAAAERADELAARLVMIPRGHLKLPAGRQERPQLEGAKKSTPSEVGFSLWQTDRIAALWQRASNNESAFLEQILASASFRHPGGVQDVQVPSGTR